MCTRFRTLRTFSGTTGLTTNRHTIVFGTQRPSFLARNRIRLVGTSQSRVGHSKLHYRSGETGKSRYLWSSTAYPSTIIYERLLMRFPFAPETSAICKLQRMRTQRTGPLLRFVWRSLNFEISYSSDTSDTIFFPLYRVYAYNTFKLCFTNFTKKNIYSYYPEQ